MGKLMKKAAVDNSKKSLISTITEFSVFPHSNGLGNRSSILLSYGVVQTILYSIWRSFSSGICTKITQKHLKTPIFTSAPWENHGKTIPRGVSRDPP